MRSVLLLWASALAVLLSGCASGPTSKRPGIEMRCALDVGSANTKLKLALVDGDRRRIKTLYFEGRASVSYVDNVVDGKIADTVIREGVRAIAGLMADAQRRLPPDRPMPQCRGVATAAFRTAKNGKEAVSWLSLKTGSSLRVISQDEETLLGFYSGLANGAGGDAVVWDIGAGTMQIAARDPERANDDLMVFHSDFGADAFMKRVVREVEGRQSPTPNPMNPRDVTESQILARKEAKRVPAALRARLADATVIGIGGVHSKAITGVLKLDPGDTYALPPVEKAIVERLGKDDGALGGKAPETRMTNLVLVAGFLQELNIKKVRPVDASLADGALVNPKLWE